MPAQLALMCAVAIVFGAFAPIAAATTVLRIGLHDAEPYAFRDVDGRAAGFCIDVVESIAASEGWTLDYVDGSWAECYEWLLEGEIDLLFPILRTEAREEELDFTTEGMVQSIGSIFARPSADLDVLPDLAGLTIGVVRGDQFGHKLREIVEPVEPPCTYIEFDTKEAVLAAIADRRVDAGMLEFVGGLRDAPDYGVTDSLIQLPADPAHIATAKGHIPTVLATLDRHLAELTADPDSLYYRSRERWLLPREPMIPEWAKWALIGTLSVILLLTSFNAALRARVRDRTRELSTRNRQLEFEISERRRAEEELAETARLKAIGELASGVTHDFGNVLTVISSTVERIREQVPDRPDVLGALDRMERAVEQAVTVTRSLLSLGRRLETRREPLELGALAASAAALLRDALPRSIEIRVERPDDGDRPWIDGEENQLHVALVNLALNARDAMPDGGTLTLAVAADEREDDTSPRARLLVTDDGHGIPEDARKRIFEPFFTTKSAQRGTGLGLTTVQRIVEDHHGRIECNSSVGGGTTFTLVFPRVAPPRRKAEAAEPPEPEVAEPEPRVAIAVRSQQVRQILAATLASEGFTAVSVTTPEALAAETRASHDIAALIVEGTELGTTIAEALHAVDRTCPVIWIAEGDDAAAPEAATILRRPFTMTTLADMLHSLTEVERQPEPGGVPDG